MSRIKKSYDQHWGGDDVNIEKFYEFLLGAQNS